MLTVDCLSLEIKNNCNSVKPPNLGPPLDLEFLKNFPRLSLYYIYYKYLKLL